MSNVVRDCAAATPQSAKANTKDKIIRCMVPPNLAGNRSAHIITPALCIFLQTVDRAWVSKIGYEKTFCNYRCGFVGASGHGAVQDRPGQESRSGPDRQHGRNR